MVQVARALVLVEERSPGVCGTSRRGLQDLQRNVDSALGIVCAPHLALPADAEPLVQDVAGRQSPSGRGGAPPPPVPPAPRPPAPPARRGGPGGGRTRRAR